MVVLLPFTGARALRLTRLSNQTSKKETKQIMLTILEILIVAVLGLLGLAVVLTKGGVFRSIKNKSIAAAEDLNESIRDPQADGKVAIMKAKEEIADLKKRRESLLVQIKELEHERSEAAFDVTKYERLARAAGDAGNEGDVVKALTFKSSAEEEQASLDGEIAKNKQLADRIKGMIDERAEAIESAARDHRFLSISIAHDNMREKIAKELDEANDSVSALTQLSKDARKAKAKADIAEEEVRTGDGAASLEKAYDTPKSKIDPSVLSRYLKTPPPAAAA
jgi:phage shock protein A